MNKFEIIEEVIRNRRSSKPALMNGKKIEDSLVKQLLQLADWAPTHAHTEPWRFIVYSGDKVKEFCANHADLYKETVAPEKFLQATYDKLLHTGDTVSHLIIAYTKRTENAKIPAIEEVCATAAAIQNLLLGAAALDIAVLWSTGGLIHNPAMKKHLELQDDDVVLGQLLLGYTDEANKEGKRIIPLDEKVSWK